MQAEFKWGSNSNTSATSSPVHVADSRGLASGLYAGAICESYDEPGEVEEMCAQIRDQLDGANPDFALRVRSEIP